MADIKKLVHSGLEGVYAEYPKKMGKKPGMRLAVMKIKTLEQLEDLKTAIRNYRSYLAKEGVEKQYILYFSTFMNQWEDWLDPETGTVSEMKADLTGLGFEA